MKTVRNAKTAIILVAVALMCSGVFTYAVSYCEIKLAGCPQDYDGRHLIVPEDVIALSTQIRACGIADSSEIGGDGVPAVMFIIDHSRSMNVGMDGSCGDDGGGQSGHDPTGNRFRVTRALIDSIYNAYPQAEVGMVFFNSSLVLNSSQDPRLEDFTGTLSSSDRAFMPLQTLNTALDITGDNAGYYNVSRSGDAEGSPTVRGLYSSIFDIPASGDAALVRPNPSNNNPNRTTTINTNSGTDISLAFEAALQAFEATEIPRDNQYIIFISDGEAGYVSGTRESMLNNYIAGENTPTTYTIYLSECVTPPWPQTLRDMNDNIMSNGYSATNPTSFIEILAQASYDDLLELMMEKIINPMLSKSEGEAKRIVITSGPVRDSTDNMSDGDFIFSRQLPIDTADITAVDMNIRYDVRIDSTWTLSDGRDTTATVRIVRDSLFEYSFTVQRSRGAGDTWEVDNNVISECGTKPTLDLLYQGTSVIGGEIKGFMDTLTIRFNTAGSLLEYNSVTVEVMNADGTFMDIENFSLTKSGDIWTYRFRRDENLVGALTGTLSADGILQHASQDSIIVIFRNPDFPLDTLRVSVPYVSTTIAFYDGPGDPKAPGVDTLGASYTVIAGDPLDIFAKFFDPDGNWDPSFENDPSKITWTVTDQNNAALTFDGVHGIFYSETAGRNYTVTATYKDGPMVLTASIVITVVPGAPRFLDVLFDTTNIAAKVDTNGLKAPKYYEFDKDQDAAVFYVFARDRFGNLIDGGAVGSEWNSSDAGMIVAVGKNNGTSADIVRQSGSSGEVRIIVTKAVDGVNITAEVGVAVIGESLVAVGPNPFVPGRDSPEDRLRYLDQQNGTNTYEIYKDIIDGKSPGGGTVTSANASRTGVLVAATAPRSIRVVGNRAQASVVIYDAVGNIVYRSSDLAVAADGNTFGLVWDGKNTAGRTVGPGTYLVRMVGTMSNGQRFSTSRRVGVTSAKSK